MPLLATQTFNTFSRLPGTDEAIDACVRFATTIIDGGSAGWLIMRGGKGTGKTHLAVATGKLLISVNNFGIRFWETTSFLDFFRGLIDQGQEFQTPFMSHCNVPVLIFDDLGMERPTPWAIERLERLFNHRYTERLPTLVTTNLDEVEISKRTSPRIADRLFDTGTGLSRTVLLDLSSYRTGRGW